MENFWDYSVWGTLNVVATLLAALLVANLLKKTIKPLQASLIPTSVLGGLLLLLFNGLFKLSTGRQLFEEPLFGTSGTMTLEMLTYHCLALGFIASTLKTTEGKINKKRSIEILNTGITTVSTYLLQAVVGFGITIVASLILKDFFAAAGVLLPFGYGQGTGQTMNYGNIYETEYGFVGGKSFGLTIAALGFLSASIGGVIYLNYLKRKGRIRPSNWEKLRNHEPVERENEIPMQESIDKMTVQIALIIVAYLATFGIMTFLGNLLPGMRSLIFGFNFLIGVLCATGIKGLLNVCKKTKMLQKEYTNNFLLTRASNFFFDIMVVSGIAAIRLSVLEQYWGIMLILGVSGLVITYAYNYWVAHKLFPEYPEEQFLMMYGMLTGTASTGIILLRELDGEFKTPAADNMVYQNFPAIVLGFPIMLLATLAPQKPYLTFGLLALFFAVLLIALFRSRIFCKKKR
ncbi:MAG: hypothetical protein J6K89_05825 [Oscillospiraceae bacterium]|nr:hypothetical protein [Oscillospiraceae bacterium]